MLLDLGELCVTKWRNTGKDRTLADTVSLLDQYSELSNPNITQIWRKTKRSCQMDPFMPDFYHHTSPGILVDTSPYQVQERHSEPQEARTAAKIRWRQTQNVGQANADPVTPCFYHILYHILECLLDLTNTYQCSVSYTFKKASTPTFLMTSRQVLRLRLNKYILKWSTGSPY